MRVLLLLEEERGGQPQLDHGLEIKGVINIEGRERNKASQVRMQYSSVVEFVCTHTTSATSAELRAENYTE